MSTTAMDPARFRQRLDAELAELPDGPTVAGDVAAGRRLLRRRRRLTLVTATLVVGLGGGAWALADHDTTPTRFLSDPMASEMSDATLTRACREQWRSDTSPEAVDALWGAGRPRLQARDTLGSVTVAAVESADGRSWASCSITEGPVTEFASSLEVFDNRDRDTGFQYGTRPDCLTAAGAIELDCDQFLLDVVDHLPAEVATVRVVLADGEVLDRPTRDGYYSLVAPYTLPPGHDRAVYRPIARVTYLGADGTPLAAQAMNGTGEGSDAERVADLPLLAAYPGFGREALG